MQNTTKTVTRTRPLRPDSGLSMLEVLIAMVVLMVVALAIVPLLMHAVANNHRSAETTRASGFTASGLETLRQRPWDGSALGLRSGMSEKSWTERQLFLGHSTEEPWVVRTPDVRWRVVEASEPSPGAVHWERTVTVRQFSLGDLEPDPATGLSCLDAPLPGGTPAELVHLKAVDVRVRSGRRAGFLGAGQDSTVRMLRAF